MNKVYVAGPYTKGDVAQNIRIAILAADRLSQAGLVPFIPHLTHFWHLLCPHEWEFWMEQSLAWVEVCDCLLRLPGESIGADREIERARQLGLSVYLSIESLIDVAMGKPYQER